MEERGKEYNREGGVGLIQREGKGRKLRRMDGGGRDEKERKGEKRRREKQIWEKGA